MSKADLKLDWCSHAAAKYAVEHWHYSRRMPKSKLVRIGVWEHGRFVGTVIFGSGAAPQAGCPFGVDRHQVCELVRVALRDHESAVSRIVRVALRLLIGRCPKLRIVVSYADPEQGHVGIIYKAGGWFYLGKTSLCEHFVDAATGQRIHSHVLRRGRRGHATRLKSSGAIRSVKTWKYKYVMPLDREMQAKIEPLRKPYPKRAGSIAGDATANQAEEGGSTPTSALSDSTDLGLEPRRA